MLVRYRSGRRRRFFGRPVSAEDAAALGCAVNLLWPGGCFLGFGALLFRGGFSDLGWVWLVVAAVLLVTAGILGFTVYRRTRPPPPPDNAAQQ